MAEIEVELVLENCSACKSLRPDPKELTKAIQRRLKQILKRIVNDAMREKASALLFLSLSGKT
jgi:hypothetical protein